MSCVNFSTPLFLSGFFLSKTPADSLLLVAINENKFLKRILLIVDKDRLISIVVDKVKHSQRNGSLQTLGLF